MDKLQVSLKKSAKSLINSMPAIIGIVLLIGLISNLLSKENITAIFFGNDIIDTLIGSVIGSITAGNPITSYIISGELLKNGVSLLAITAFIIAWVTVGVVQLPAESIILGKKFAVGRNILAFISSIIVASVTCLIVGVL